MINRHGELYESGKDAAGLKESLDNLAWMAPRSGEVIVEDIEEQGNPYIAESIQAMEGLAEEDAEDAIWIRIVQDAVVPEKGTFGGMEHKDYLFYRHDESAYVCIQSA